MKTVFLLLPVGITVRNFLHTGLLDRLTERPDVRLVVFTPAAKALATATLGDRITVRPMPAGPAPRSRKALHAVLRRRFYRTHETASTKILQRGPLSQKRLAVLGSYLMGQPFPRSRLIYEWLRALDRAVLKADARVEAVFDELSPSLVIATHPTAIDEYDFLKLARSRGVPSIAMIKTWDNLTMKGYMAAPADQYFVWNDTMRRELEQIHGIPGDVITVTGIAQFDPYADREAVEPRVPFFDRLGLDAGRRTILYATSPQEVNEDDPEIVRRLAASVGRELPADVQIIARLHQIDTLDRYRGIAAPHLVYQVPGARYGDDPQRRLMDPQFITDLRDTMMHSDIVINTCSTMTLDAVAADRPVISVAFDLAERGYYRSCIRYYDLDHYQPILRSGAARIARGFDEFLAEIRRYLTDPQLESAERAQLRASMCYRVDGQAGARIARAVFRVLDRSTAGGGPDRHLQPVGV